MRTVEEFAAALIDRYLDDLDAKTAEVFVADPYAAGEFEVAAISMIEDGPVTAAEVDELERLADSFPTPHREIAHRVVAKRRKHFAD